MQNTAHVLEFRLQATPTERALADQFATVATAFVATMTGIEDPSTVRAKVIALEEAADELDQALLDNSETPLRGTVLTDLAQHALPENLHHLLGAPISHDWGDAR